MTFSALPCLTRLRIGPAEQAAAWFLEAREIEPTDYHVAEWIPLALDLWGGEIEYEAWVELRERGIVR
mgnify:CR=1 FL=1